MQLKRRYGLDFDARTPDHQIELLCSRHWRKPEYRAGNLDDPDVHMCRAIRALFEPSEFKLNRWSERTIWAWTHYDEITLFGAASCSKSATVGMLALLDWATEPLVTTTFFTSTTVKALEKRSWSSVLSAYSLLRKKGLPAKHHKSRTAILNESDAALRDEGFDTPDAIKAGIFGIAVMSGPIQASVSNIIGVHQPEGAIRVLVDEAQATPEAIFVACANLNIGTPDVKVIALGNPMSFEDQLGRMAQPRNGWSSVTVEDEQWETVTNGICLHFDGHQSPAVTEPDGEKEFPFLIGPTHIRRVLNRCQGNPKHPSYLTMVRGWIANTSDPDVIMPKAAQTACHMHLPPSSWRAPPIRVMALDPSFSSDGDWAILLMAEVGVESDGVLRIAFHTPWKIPIEDSQDDPPLSQICRFTWNKLLEYGVEPNHLVVDETAAQTVGSAFMLLAPPGVGDLTGRPLLYNGNTSPLDVPISSYDQRSSKDVYSNMASASWYWTEAFGRYKQIRRFPEQAAIQFATRKIVSNYSRTGAMAIEPKNAYKKRGFQSPNEADSCAMIAYLCRARLAITPGELGGDPRRLGMARREAMDMGPGGGPVGTAFGRLAQHMQEIESEDNSYTSEGW
jgi:hypothetical protein